MRHFIGGACVGIILALTRSGLKASSGDRDFVVTWATAMVMSLLCGGAAWGLYP